MKAKRKSFRPSKALRARAEHWLSKTRHDIAQMPADDVQKLVHELQVHQIELEMQNDELRRTQLELEAARDRLMVPYDAAPVGFLTMDARGVIHESNLAAAGLLNFDRMKLPGQKLTRFIAPESQDIFYLHCQPLFSTGEKQTCELRLSRTGGAQRIVRLEIAVDGAGPEPATRFLVMMTDITGQKQAEETQRSERNLTDFFNRAPIGLEWLSASGTILRANQAQLDLLGYAQKEYQGRYFKDFCADPSKGTELLEQLAAKETVHNFRMLLRCKDGTHRHILVDAHASWRDGQFPYFSIFSRDITDRVKLERDILEVSEREQQRIGQDLHDGVCQQLTGIKFRTRLLEQKLAKRGVAERRDAHTIETLLNRTIEQARNQARGLNPVRIEADGFTTALQELAASVTDIFHIRCSCHLPQNDPMPDPEAAIHLYRIAQESISNAIKHGRAKKVDIRVSEHGGSLRLTIQDYGKGMPRALKHKTGMGLHIMDYRARSIGAALHIHRGSLGGTIVSCSLPRSRPQSRTKTKH
jgi:PAS domain S-box-containing protein